MNFENMLPNAGKMTEMNQQFMTSMVKMGEIVTESHGKLVGQQTAALQANLSGIHVSRLSAAGVSRSG